MHEGAPAVVLPPAEPFPSPVVSRRISAGASSETRNDKADDQMSMFRATLLTARNLRHHPGDVEVAPVKVDLRHRSSGPNVGPSLSE